MVSEDCNIFNLFIRSTCFLSDLTNSSVMVKSAEAGDIFWSDFSLRVMTENSSISIGRIGNY